jgi:hypothetical protein
MSTAQVQSVDAEQTDDGTNADRTEQGVLDYVRSALREVVLLAATAGWTVFWLNVVRLHRLHGETLSAAFALVAFVAPAVGAWLTHVLAQISDDVEVPSPAEAIAS